MGELLNHELSVSQILRSDPVRVPPVYRYDGTISADARQIFYTFAHVPKTIADAKGPNPRTGECHAESDFHSRSGRIAGILSRFQ
jgi:hypothetical protein